MINTESATRELESIAKFAHVKARAFKEQAFGDSRVEDAAQCLEDVSHMLDHVQSMLRVVSVG